MLLTSLGRRPFPYSRPSVPLFVLNLFAFLYTISSSVASAQLVNGQFYTHGLAISDAPAPNSQNNAGSSLSIAIDLSGNGKLPQEAFLPTSNDATAYQSLNIYLVSAETNLNLTVSDGNRLLQGEPGSTVKHLNWAIPACVPSGNYNLTYYESARINQANCYSITPIPIIIKSQSSSPCPGVPAPSPQPQVSSPPPEQPWLSPGHSVTTTPISPSSTHNPNPSGPSMLPSSPYPSDSGTITITLSPSPTTVTFISTVAIPTTLSGIATVVSTVTTIASVSTVVPSGSGAFVPVNAAVSVSGTLHGVLMSIAWTFIVVYVAI